MKQMTRGWWLIAAVVVAVVGAMVAWWRGWHIAAIVLALIALVAGLFAVREWRAVDAMERSRGMVVDTVRNTVRITWSPNDSGQVAR